jgi:hypothetical protein
MTRDHQHNPDPNARRIVKEATRDESKTPMDLERAWQEWSQNIQKVDERAMLLLTATFEAGRQMGRNVR